VKEILLPTARLTDKAQISKLRNLLYNKDFYTASKFHIKFLRFNIFFDTISGRENPGMITPFQMLNAPVKRYSANSGKDTELAGNLCLKRLEINL
jgi:hypothetical protein